MATAVERPRTTIDECLALGDLELAQRAYKLAWELLDEITELSGEERDEEIMVVLGEVFERFAPGVALEQAWADLKLTTEAEGEFANARESMADRAAKRMLARRVD